MRYTGPVKQEVAKGGEFLISRARVLLGQVEDRLSRSSLQQLVSRTETGDGWYIVASNILGQRFIGIYKEPVEPIEAVCNADYLSGFLDWINWFDYAQDGYIERVSLYDVETGARSGWENSEELLPAFTGGGSALDDLGIPGVGGKTSCSPFFTKFSSTPAIQKSSCYSGEMCKVISLLQGYKKPIAFNHCWGETDGIWVSGYGDRYVIRISIIEGVTAWKLPVCEELSEERKAELKLDYPFLPKPVTSIPPLASRILLMSAREMAQSGYPATYPYSFELGWSFSSDGHKAIQTSWSWPDAWKRAHLWEMEITSYDGKEPNVATLAKTEETYIWGDYWGNISFPQYLPAGGMGLVTFDPRSDPVLAGAPPGSYSLIPYYAFYPPGERTTPVVIRTSDADAPEDEIVDREEVPSNYHYCTATRKTMKAPGVGAGVFGTGLVRYYAMKRFFEASGPVSGMVEPEVSYNETGSMRVYSTFQDGSWYQNGSGVARAISQHYTSYTDYASPATHDYTRYHTILIPIFNRSTFYEFTKWRDDVYSEAATRFTDGMGYGDHLHYTAHPSQLSLCNGINPQYHAIPCYYPLPEFDTFSIFYPYGHGWWCSPPSNANMFTPGDACYDDPDVVHTYYWCRTGATPAPKSTCPANGVSILGFYQELDSGMELRVYNWDTKAMELVKEWEPPGAYDPYDGYMTEKDWSGGSLLVSHYEPFNLKGFQSKEMNGFDDYHFIGSPESKYPVLSTITPGLDRTFIGVPFASGE